MSKFKPLNTVQVGHLGSTLLVATLLLITSNAQSQQVGDTFVFPGAGQTQDQQALDSFQCQSWAREHTGFDPMQRAPAASPPPQQSTIARDTTRGVFAGALTGAALGAIVDGGDGAGKGALAGGLLGGVTGNARSRSNATSDRSAWQQQQAAEYDRNRGNWNRAFGVCMEARNYTVG